MGQEEQQDKEGLRKNLKALIQRIQDYPEQLVVFGLACSGFGIAIHAVASELFYKGGYPEILSLQGEWIGLLIALVAFIYSIKFWR